MLRGVEKKKTPRDDVLSIFLKDDAHDEDLVPTRFIPTRTSKKRGIAGVNEKKWRWNAGQIANLHKAIAFGAGPQTFGETYSPLLGRSSTTLRRARLPIVNTNTPPALDIDRAAERILDRVIALNAKPDASTFRGWLWFQGFLSSFRGDDQIQALMDRWIEACGRAGSAETIFKGFVRRWAVSNIAEASFADADSDSEGEEELSNDTDSESDEGDPTYDEESSNDGGGESDLMLSDEEEDELLGEERVERYFGRLRDESEEALELPDTVSDHFGGPPDKATFDQLESPAHAISVPFPTGQPPPPRTLTPPPSPPPSSFAMPTAADEVDVRFAALTDNVDKLTKSLNTANATLAGLSQAQKGANEALERRLSQDREETSKALQTRLVQDRKEINEDLKKFHDQYIEGSGKIVNAHMKDLLQNVNDDDFFYTAVIRAMQRAMRGGLAQQEDVEGRD